MYYVGSLALAAAGGYVVGRAAAADRPRSSTADSQASSAASAAATTTASATGAASTEKPAPLDAGTPTPAATAAAAPTSGRFADTKEPATPALAGMTGPNIPETLLSLNRQRSEEPPAVTKTEDAPRRPRGRLVVVSYQLPVKLIKIERKATDAKAPVAAPPARSSVTLGRPTAATAATAGFSGSKVKFDPNDIDIGEDSDNEDNKAAKAKAAQKKRGKLGGSLGGLGGGLGGRGSAAAAAADSDDDSAAGKDDGNPTPSLTSGREPRYTVQWDDARNFLSNLRVMQPQHTTGTPNPTGYYPTDVTWVGVPNIQTEDKDEMEEITQLLEKHNCHPVFLKKDLKERFFDGFCKGVMWPLLHYTMPQAKVDFAEKWDDAWQAYTGVNSIFAKEVTSVCEWQHDMVWIHNYHLFLLPSFLRKKMPRAKIGFFVHTTFPTSDVFRILPSRESILRGIMAADLVGFHTFDYARHFLSSCKRILDLDFETLPGGQIGISYSGRDVSILISHVGIESHVFQKAAHTAKVLARRDAIRKKFAPRRIILGIDDLDLVKGSVTKLQGLSRFLADNPDRRDTVVLVQVVQGSSNSLAEQKAVRESMMAEINSIRQKYGPEILEVMERVSWDVDELVAWYLAAEVAVISTYWDGLNMTPYEFTASQHEDSPGTLVLSEFMGCVRSLNGVTRVNPWALEKMSEAIALSLDQSLEERQENHRRRFKYVMSHTTERWASGFLASLDRATHGSDELSFVQVGFGSSVRLVGLRSDFTHLKEDVLTAHYTKSAQRIVIFDYDGTITTTAQKLPPPTDEVVAALRTLSEDPKNTVFVVSGRRRKQLGAWFAHLPQLGLAAEKGCYVRWPARLRASRPALSKVKITVSSKKPQVPAAAATASGSSSGGSSGGDSKSGDEEMWDAENWETLVPTNDFTWKIIALEIIKAYTENTDGSYIEDKESAIVWHYEQADPEYGRMQASELSKYLVKILPSALVDVVRYDYNRILEIKPKGIGKGITTALILDTVLGKPSAAALQALANKKQPPPFVMCVGDDRADEEMFEALQASPLLILPESLPLALATGAATPSSSTDSKLQTPTPTPAAGSAAGGIGEDAPSDRRERLQAGASSRALYQPSLFTTTVGIKPSAAHYYCNDSDEVIEMLVSLAACADTASAAQRKPKHQPPTYGK